MKEENKWMDMISSGKRITALDFYHSMGKFISNLKKVPREIDLRGEIVNKEIINLSRDERDGIAIHRLEREISELRSMIGGSPDIEAKLRDLQIRVEEMQENTERIKVGETESAIDILQKFLSSDKKVFVIMPFQRDLENVWAGAIKPSCTDCHYASLRVDEVNLSSLITDDIEKYSTIADVVIVDITGNNPNVMFEFGWALAKNKKPIVICQGEDTKKIPFDVRGIRYIPYENSWLGIENLKKKIKEYLNATDKQSPKKGKKNVKKGKSKSLTTKAKIETANSSH